MTRMERYHRAKPTRAWPVIWANTFRMVWRDPLFRLEVGMLGLLTLLAAAATPGSPTAGAAAIQMAAVAYAVSPFALVLVVGQLTHEAMAEAAWWNRPVTRAAYYGGRFLGLVAAALPVMAALAIFGGLVSALIAHLPVGPSIVWSLGLSAALALPGLVLVCGIFLLLAEWTGGGSRYFPPAILVALVLAFAEYKLPTLVAFAPHLGFFNPFPSFLALGLALPPLLLGRFPVPGWLLVNRSAWLLVGIGLVLLAVRHRRGYAHRYLDAGSSGAGVGLIVIALAAVGAGFDLHRSAVRLSPAVSVRSVEAADPLQSRRVDVAIAVDAKGGTLTGRETFHVPADGTLPTRFLLNRGLRLVSVRDGDARVSWREAAGRPVIAGTAARLITLEYPPGARGGTLLLRYTGALLPYPSLLPYPPFSLGRVYESMAAGAGRVFLNEPGTWLARPVSAGGSNSLAEEALHGTLRLSVQGLSPADRVLTNLHSQKKGAGRYQGPLSDAVFLAAPYRKTALLGITVYGRAEPSRASLAALRTYGRAWMRLAPFFAGRGETLTAVESPVALAPMLTPGPLLVFSGVNPYFAPLDPVTREATPPKGPAALGRLALAWWNTQASRFGYYPWQATGLKPSRVAPMLAAVTMLRAATPAVRAMLRQDLHAFRASLPGVGSLDPTEVRLIRQIAPAVDAASSARFRAMLHALPGAWPNLHTMSDLAGWIAAHGGGSGHG